jgi:undecaprenyl-diphosphatase
MSVTDWDLTLLVKINQEWTHPVLDRVMASLSAVEAWFPLFGLVLLVAVWKGGVRARWMLVCVAVALAVGDGVVSNGLKKAVGRVRPRDAMEGVVVRDLGKASPPTMRLFVPLVVKPSRVLGEERGKSFPSSHTVNLFAVATVVGCFYRGWGMVAFVLAGAVAWSRVYCGAHWPSDIPASMALGVGTGVLVVWVVGRVRRVEGEGRHAER